MDRTLPWIRCCAALVAAACIAGPAAATQSLPDSLPVRRDVQLPTEDGPWLPALALLGVAAAAGGFALWRRGGAAGRAGSARRDEAGVARLSSQALTPHASVHAVRWDGQEFLLACTAQQVTLLARRTLPPGEAS